MVESRNGVSLWTVDQLKGLFRVCKIPVGGNKTELVRKIMDIFYPDSL